jgi:hypothetical protein
MKKIVHFSKLFFVSFLMASCGTLFSPSKTKITIKSEPSGADVYINEELKGKTPLEFTLNKNAFKRFDAKVRLKGYTTADFQIKKEFNTVSILNTTSLLSWGTDALTGGIIQYAPNLYYIELKKEGAGSTSSIELPSKESDLLRFTQVNFQKLKADITKGNGDYLDAYLSMRGLNLVRAGLVKMEIKKKSAFLVQINDPKELNERLKKL